MQTTPPGYTHLHVHSHYTLLGATAPVTALVERAKQDGLTHLALTDTNVLYGAVAFQQACNAVGIQPIVGMALRVQLPTGFAASVQREFFVLLATGTEGYRSLCRLSSAIQGSPLRETLAQQGITWDALREQQAGLVAIVGGRRSPLESWLRADERKTASQYLSRLAGLFDERLYLAIESYGGADKPVGQQVAALGARFGLGCVAVQPIYCLMPEERPRLRLLAAIDHNCPLADVPATALPDQGDTSLDLHWLDSAEMMTRFAAFPAALAATQTLVEGCQPALPDGRPIWPALKLPAGETPETALTRLAETGLQQRYGATETGAESPDTLEVNGKRLHYELGIITKAGYAPLFLLVADIVRYARAQAIPVSTRGSVANSLVAYCVGITTVDPIAHDLLFERFLNPERGSPPDIDLDFCSLRRDEVLAYIREIYGEERVAMVATVSTMRPRSAVGETAKAYELPEAEAEMLVKLLPDAWHPDPRRRVDSSLEAILEKVSEPRQREVVAAAYALIGQPHHLSIHPGGVVVTPGPLTDIVPVQWTPKGILITQFDHTEVEALGLPKIDLLGIRALTVLAETSALVRQHYDPAFRLEGIPLDDTATGQLLNQAETVGVFQCESSGARRTLRQLQVRTVQDLAIANAFFKPGPATGGMAASFIRRYRGEETPTYLHPALEPLLGATKGVLIFQEQVLRVAHTLAGLRWSEADHLRKGMSKFQPQAMERMRSRFLQGCQRPAPTGPGFTPEQAETLWAQIVAFAGYGFNQGHATAYADVSYRSAYLKAHYPAAFLAARLANYGGFHHPAIYIAEARRLGIPVRPPHIQQSNHHFSLRFAEGNLEQPVLWMGLGQVRSLRHNTIEAIHQQRAVRPFADLEDFYQRVNVQRKELTHLIQCGALDGMGESRSALLATAEELRSGQPRYQLAFDFVTPPIEIESPVQRLQWERQVLGQPLSVHPLATVTLDPRQFRSLREAAAQPGRSVQVAATRLPGWTGGKGFFVDDGETYTIAIPNRKITPPKPWTPLQLTGRWQSDEWGSGWLQVETLEQMLTG